MSIFYSIIIPTYHEEKNISRLLTQLENFNLPGEVIVADGGSLDGTVCVVKERFPWVKLIQTEKGRGQQLAAAVAASVGNVLVFIHADSQLKPGYFGEVEKAVSRDALWGSGKVVFDNPKRIYRIIERCSNLRASILHSCFGDQAMYCTREFYQEIGGFRPMTFLEDLEFSRRAAARIKPVILDSKILTSSRLYEKQGVYRTIYRMQMVKLLYQLGFSQEKIWQFYHKSKE